MTLPPIVDRELRAAARRGATYRGRVLTALAAIVIGASIFVVNFGRPEREVGPRIFIGLSILAFLYCLFAGRRSTVDCLSSEKREGTLGLLFLTDLKGRHVVLGKLAATSLNGFLGLLALFPILALPLMMGGISNAQFWRIVLVLMVTFLLSLSIGIFASSVCREFRRAASFNLALILLLSVVAPGGIVLLAGAAGASGPPIPALYSSPIFAFVIAFDAPRTTVPFAIARHFWGSIIVLLGLSWFFLFRASRIVPKSWQEDIKIKSSKKKAHSGGVSAAPNPYRKRLLDINAFYWLTARNRFKPLQVWLFLGAMFFWWVMTWVVNGDYWNSDPVKIMFILLVNTTLKLWIALESGQRLAEDRKAGALELLLSTPLTGADIIRGQFLTIRRQFLKPLTAVALVHVFFMWTALHPTFYSGGGAGSFLFILVSLILLVVDACVLPLVALESALVTRNPQLAVLRTTFLVLLWPRALCGLVLIYLALGSQVAGQVASLLIYCFVTLLFDSMRSLNTRRSLNQNFRLLASERASLPNVPLPK